MSEPQAYLNGQFIPASQAVVPVSDGGFVQGTTVAEQLRTFGGKLFKPDVHVERLFRSLAILEIDPGLSFDQILQVSTELASINHALLAPGDDLNLAIFVTPGPYSAMVARSGGPIIGMHAFPLRFDLWAEKYHGGQALATTDVEQVPARCWPPELKCRSRMHYFLADRQAHNRHPGSRAVMLDEQGFVTETTTANIILADERGGLILPPNEKVLPGISLATLVELADELSLPHLERDVTPSDLARTSEIFLTSTSPCMLPVLEFNGHSIGSGQPGPIYTRLLEAWSKLVGLDIAEQARRFSTR